MERERPSSPVRSGSTAGVAARAILASSTAPEMRAAAGAARIGLALTRRPGHVVVTGPDGDVAAALVRATESQLDGMRLVREAGADVRVEQLLRALRGTSAGERRAAVVTNAGALDVASLERLHAGLDAAALERGDVRLVLVGGPELRRTLRDARLGDLMARVCLHLDVPAPDADALGEPDEVVPAGGPVRRRALRVGSLMLAALAGAIALRTWFDAEPMRRQVRSEVVAMPQDEVATPVTTAAEAPTVAESPTVVVAPAVPESPAQVEPVVRHAAPHASGFSLQVGAFARAANASRLAARLRPRFDGVEVTTVRRGTRTLHRVRIGGFASEAARRSAMQRLSAEGIEAFPVRRAEPSKGS